MKGAEKRRAQEIDDDFIALLLEHDLDDEIPFVQAMAKVAGDTRYLKVADMVCSITTA